MQKNIIYDTQEFHAYRKPYCGHVFLLQASHYRDITFRIDAGMDGTVSVTLPGSVV